MGVIDHGCVSRLNDVDYLSVIATQCPQRILTDGSVIRSGHHRRVSTLRQQLVSLLVGICIHLIVSVGSPVYQLVCICGF